MSGTCSESYSTLSSVIPFYIDLEIHLEEMKKPLVASVAEVLLTELHKHFNSLTDVHDPDHIPVYLMATLLDPRYRMSLTDEHTKSA